MTEPKPEGKLAYMPWLKTEGLGHQRIFVYCYENGVAPHDTHVQCSTVDRIPFKMKRKDLIAR